MSVYLRYGIAKYGVTGYLNAKNYSDRHNHEMFISKLKESLDKNDKKLPIRHHVKIHEGFVPLWVAVEYFLSVSYRVFIQILQQRIRKLFPSQLLKEYLSRVV